MPGQPGSDLFTGFQVIGSDGKFDPFKIWRSLFHSKKIYVRKVFTGKCLFFTLLFYIKYLTQISNCKYISQKLQFIVCTALVILCTVSCEKKCLRLKRKDLYMSFLPKKC